MQRLRQKLAAYKIEGSKTAADLRLMQLVSFVSRIVSPQFEMATKLHRLNDAHRELGSREVAEWGFWRENEWLDSV